MGNICNNEYGCGKPGFFSGYQSFWIIVVIAIVVIWVHYASGCGNNRGCGCNDGCLNSCG